MTDRGGEKKIMDWTNLRVLPHTYFMQSLYDHRHNCRPNPVSSVAGSETRPVNRCPYCSGKDIIKSGWRKKKLENKNRAWENHGAVFLYQKDRKNVFSWKTKLALFFVGDDGQSQCDDDQSAKNVEVSHNFVYIIHKIVL
jgi:hypothetical protein